MGFAPGERIKCVDARGSAFLTKGATYTVAVSYGPYVTLQEYPRDLRYRGFFQPRFVRAQRTDIAMFTAMLDAAGAQPALAQG